MLRTLAKRRACAWIRGQITPGVADQGVPPLRRNLNDQSWSRCGPIRIRAPKKLATISRAQREADAAHTKMMEALERLNEVEASESSFAAEEE